MDFATLHSGCLDLDYLLDLVEDLGFDKGIPVLPESVTENWDFGVDRLSGRS